MAEMCMSKPLSPSADEVRRHDWDRFICTLFAPEDRREDLFTLLAFNLELARTREMVTEPLLGEMRLQWWRDAIDGIYDGSREDVAGHYVLEHLPGVIRSRRLSKSLFIELIETRLLDLSDQPPADMNALEAYARGTSSALNLIQLEILGYRNSLTPEVEALGLAWALTGLMRALPAFGRLGRSPLPRSLLPAERDLMVVDEDVRNSVRTVCQVAEQYLEEACQSRARDIAAVPSLFLLRPLCRSYLTKLARAKYDPSSPVIHQGRARRQLMLWLRARVGMF